MYANVARQLRERTAERAKRARARVILLLPVLGAVVFAYLKREELFGLDLPVRIVAVVALVILGWAFAQSLGRAVGPLLFDRLGAESAGAVGFLVRLATLGLAILVAFRIAGLEPRMVAVGGAVTAVVFGLAAQQTLGNLIAGVVLLSARPFRVGDRVRLHAGGIAGDTEGVVTSLGLLYTTLSNGEDRIMIPNSVVLSSAVVPLREPSAVDLRARLQADRKPSEVQHALDESVEVPTRSAPQIGLEQIEGDEVVVRVSATPVEHADGPRLADEVLAVLTGMSGDGRPSSR